jgi:RHS repeat-associated protein
LRHWFGTTELWYDTGAKALGPVAKTWVHALLDRPIARIENATEVEYSHHSGLDHLSAVVDAGGRLKAGFVYGPFGELLDRAGSTEDHSRRFNGEEIDGASGLIYYGFRYYDPLSLQWTQGDPLYRLAPDLANAEPRRMNLYTFSLNAPVRYVDPDGRQPTNEIDGPEVDMPALLDRLGTYRRRLLAAESRTRDAWKRYFNQVARSYVATRQFVEAQKDLQAVLDNQLGVEGILTSTTVTVAKSFKQIAGIFRGCAKGPTMCALSGAKAIGKNFEAGYALRKKIDEDDMKIDQAEEQVDSARDAAEAAKEALEKAAQEVLDAKVELEHIRP